MTTPAPAVEVCCALLYGDPLVELLAGESLHPGGLATTRWMLEAARLDRGARILDAGCGLGATARLAAREFGLSVDGCDVSAAAVRRAITLAEAAGTAIEFREGSVLELPYSDGSFSAAIAECMLSTIHSPALALAELRRVLAPAGRLLVSDVVMSDRTIAPEPLASALCLGGAWAPGELEQAVGQAGFAVERTSDASPSIIELIDRLEARATLVRAVVRDARSSGSLAGLLGQHASLLERAGSLAGVLDEARELVRAGRIGYLALVARASSVTARSASRVA